MTLKEEIFEIIENDFKDLNMEEKILLSQMSLMKILKKPYYKNQYRNLSLVKSINGDSFSLYDNNKDENIFINIDFKDEYSYGINFRNIENDEKIKYIYLSNEEFEKTFLFYKKVKQCDNITDFKSFITQETNKDPNYIDNLRPLSYILGGYFFEKFIFKFKKNTFDLGRNINVSNEDYNDYKTKLNEKFLIKLKNENDYFINHKSSIGFIENKLRVKIPHIFEQPNIDDIEYVFFEITAKANNEGSYIKNQSQSKQEEYHKLGITIYNDKLKEKLKEWYKLNSYSEKDLLFRHLYEQENEISKNLSKEFFGFNYISKNTFSPNDCTRSFLLAMKNNEIIGSLVYQDYDLDLNLKEKNPNLEYPFKCAVTANVKNNYRGLGLSKLMYNKLSKIMIKENFIYINTYYTDLGFNRLLKIKEQLNKENETCFFLDTDLQNNSLMKTNATKFLSLLIGLKNTKFIRENINNLKNLYNNNCLEVSKLISQKEDSKIDIITLIDKIDEVHEKAKIDIQKLIKPISKNKRFKI